MLTSISKHNEELGDLQQKHSNATRTLYDLAIQNESLESNLLSLKTDRDTHVVLDQRHKIEMLKVDTQDAIRRASRMEMSCAHTISQW